MANKNKTEDQFAQIEETLSKTEQFIEENQKSLMTIIGAIVGIVALFSVYQNFYIEPMEKEAQAEMYMAELYFQKDSFNLALNGDGQYLGFLDIANDYSSTNVGQLANYYAGLSYLHTADYDNAIEYLGDFSSDDIILSSLALGCMGDAYMELGDTDAALDAYADAVNNSDCVILMTPWEQYSKLQDADFKKMRKKNIIDTRRILNIHGSDINYIGLGIGY